MLVNRFNTLGPPEYKVQYASLSKHLWVGLFNRHSLGKQSIEAPLDKHFIRAPHGKHFIGERHGKHFIGARKGKHFIGTRHGKLYKVTHHCKHFNRCILR